MDKAFSLWRDTFCHITLIYVSYRGILKWACKGVLCNLYIKYAKKHKHMLLLFEKRIFGSHRINYLYFTVRQVLLIWIRNVTITYSVTVSYVIPHWPSRDITVSLTFTFSIYNNY